MAKPNKRTTSLVLGSGGARGLAHIGVIHWLEENNFMIKSISGCSMGALIGGIYAAGKLDDFEQWVLAITRVDIVALLDLAWDRSGLVRGDKIINTLIDLVGDQLIEDLPISFTAVATDIGSGKEVWIKSGKLFDAIRASISLPMFFTPFKYRGADLIDGGVLNPVPIAPTFGDETDMTIAVNLAAAVEPENKPVDSPTAPLMPSLPALEKVSRFIDNLKKSGEKASGLTFDVFDISNQAFDAMQSTIARQKLAAYPPDSIIEISRKECRTLEFHRAAEMITLGHKKAEAALAELVK